MKKMMKSMVCIAIAVALVLSLAACGCGYANSPEGVIKRVINAQNNHDYVTLEKYYEDGEAYEDYADEKINSIKAYYNYILEEEDEEFEYMEEMMGEKNLKAWVNAQIEIEKAVAKRCKVEIDKVDQDGDEAWVEYTVYEPEVDYEDVWDAVYDEIGLEEDEMDDADEGEYTKFIKAYKKHMLKAIKEADVEESYEAERRVVKDDGKWKIAEDQSKED